MSLTWRHDIQHNNTQHNDTQHNIKKCYTQSKITQHQLSLCRVSLRCATCFLLLFWVFLWRMPLGWVSWHRPTVLKLEMRTRSELLIFKVTLLGTSVIKFFIGMMIKNVFIVSLAFYLLFKTGAYAGGPVRLNLSTWQ